MRILLPTRMSAGGGERETRAQGCDVKRVCSTQWMKMWSVCAHTVDEDVERVLRQMGKGIPIDIWPGKTNCMPGTVVGMRE